MKEWNVGWGLTQACNLKCEHCYNASGKQREDELSLEQTKKIVLKLKKNNVKSINYGTGECSLRKDFWDLVKYVHEHKITQGLTTNGISVTENTIPLIKKYMNDIDVSVDFPNKRKHNKFRGHKKAWDIAINALRLLKKNKINASIVACITSKNCNKRDIGGLLNLCKKYGCDLRINWFRPTGRGKKNKKLELNPKKVHKMFKFILSNSILKAIPDPYFAAILKHKNLREVGCPCGQTSFRITPNGTVVPCVYFTKEMKNISILKSSFNKITKSKPFIEINNRKLEFCKDCEFFKVCKGGCASRAFLSQKSVNTPDSFCFKLNNIPKSMIDSIKYTYRPGTFQVHENYLCTLIVKPK